VATVRARMPGRSTTWRVSSPRIRSRIPSARKIAWTPGRSASSPIQPRPVSAGATRSAAPAATRPAAMARAASRALTTWLLAGRDDRDDAPATAGAELHDPGALGEDRVVPAEPGAVTGPEPRAPLAHDDLAPRDGLAGEDLHPEHVLVAAVEQRLERHGVAGVGAQALDEEGLALLDAVLLAAGLDDRVGHGHSSAEPESPPSAAAPALARERRRPPLRPRRRVRDCTSSALSPAGVSPPVAAPLAATSDARAAVRPTSSMRTSRF